MPATTGLIKSRLFNPLMVAGITLLTCLFVLAIYMHGSLQGNFNHFFMPAEKFGIPNDLKARGLTEMYKGPIETGWDGQFYYYISNDILAQKDTVQHIDSNAYRYQRIGLPLLAKSASILTGQSWVSPLTYYMTNLALLLIAAGIAANWLKRNNINPYFILLWSIGCGTQVTLLHGLPDGAADALLILALITLLDKRHWTYVFTMTFAALSREVYVLFPCFILLSLCIQSIRITGLHKSFSYQNLLSLAKQSWTQVIPILLFSLWQIFIRSKFGVSPSSQAGNVLGWPFYHAFHYIAAGLHGIHPQIGAGKEAYLEAIGIILFLTLLIVSAQFLISLLNLPKIKEKPIYTGIALTFLSLIALYICFGPIVIMRYSGYFKATNIFMFVIPFAAALLHRQIRMFTCFFLIFTTLFFNYLLWESVSEPPYHPMPIIHYVSSEPACLKDYRVKIVPVSFEEPATHGLLKKLLVKRTLTAFVKITNLSTQDFSPYQGKGNVNLSYQWINVKNSNVVRDGVRTSLPHTLSPHQSIVLPTYINFPTSTGEYLLKVSLVQEGCNWFYLENPNSAFTIPYAIR
jgi:hypothetical protein